ncbi:MAG: LexA family transcriptional regulator [Prevotella sp.]|nr:LexA family transcriptional regulator [Prevotella sp.]MCM1074071.1 LexA family transcriptional regulator [Ruminococcus sp.]
MTDKDKILALHHYSGMSLKRLAEECGIGTPQTLYDIKNGKHGISRDVASRIRSRFPEVSLGWLLAGVGEMLDSSDDYTDNIIDTPEANKVPLVPISAFAGPIKAFTADGVRTRECETVYSPTSGAELALTVSGDSMEPNLQDGTIIFIKRINDEAFIPWGHTMVLDTENGAFVKDVYPGNTQDVVVARSKNTKYPDMVIPRESIFGIYRVLNAVKSFGLM